MPLYEIVLRYADREEVRLTDRAPALGERLEIAGYEWNVVLEREPGDVRATARFLCDLSLRQRARAASMRAANAEQRERMQLVQERRRELDDRIGEHEPTA